MSYINFNPWVGKDYFTKGFQGMRILVLRESHYCKNELAKNGRCFPLCLKENMDSACYSQTQDVIYDMIYKYKGEPYQRTFICFERAMLGKELTQAERETFWHSVIFYNYLQYSQSAPRTTPQSEHWAESKEAFSELLEKYSPEKIIVWGVRLYDYLHNINGKNYKLIVSDNNTAEVRYISLNGQNIPALKMTHPSCPIGKNWEYWHKIISKFLEQK